MSDDSDEEVEKDDDVPEEMDYETMKAALQYEKNNTMNMTRIKEGYSEFTDGVRSEMSQSIELFKEMFTPDFLKRMKYKKRFPAKVAASESVPINLANRVTDTINQDIAVREEKRITNKKRKKKIKQFRAHDNVTHEQQARAKLAEKKGDFEAVRKRLKEQWLEKRVAEDEKKKELEKRLEKEEEDLRNWRQEHWTNDSKIKYEEAIVTKKRRAADIKRTYDAAVTATYDEWSQRDHARTRMQVETPILSDPIEFPSGNTLGVFGVPKHPGAFHAAEDGGFKPGLDQADIHPFSSDPQTEHETNTIELLESEAEVSRNQGLYDSLTKESKNLEQAMERICTLRDALERDYKQVFTEQRLTDKSVSGPPRRLPSTVEQGTTHTRKSRLKQLQLQIEKHQHAIQQCENKKQRVDAQALSIAKKLAAAREKNKMDGVRVNNVNDGFGMLPVIVGRNITKVPGMDATAKPVETYNAILHQSKIISHQDQSLKALNVHREGVKMDRELWIERQGRHELKMDMEGALNRLAKINEKLKDSRVQTNKSNLIEALSAFHHSGCRLISRNDKMAGPLCWWRNRDTNTCLGCERYESRNNNLGVISFDDIKLEDVDGDEHDSEATESDSCSDIEALHEDVEAYGVSLKGGRNQGFCVGTIELPKPVMWSISFLVTRKGTGEKYAGPDKSDFVVVKLGYNVQNLKTIGIYYNTVNPENGGVLYDIKYVCSGGSLAYRFEFSSGSLNANHHLVVSAGMYEEYEVLPLESVDIINGRERVISSFVRMLRLDEAQGKNRLTKLIEELLNTEESQSAGWDSEVIQNYPQRYERDFFLRILRAEILVEREKTKRDEEDDPSGATQSDPKRYMTEEEFQRVERSEAQYIKRKQETQYHIISDAREMVGKRLDVLDKDTGKWRTVKVQNCLVNWIQNGEKVFIQHTLQEVNKFNENVGKEFVADISLFHYVESPEQEVDKEAVARLLEFRAWEERLHKVDEDAESSVKEKKKRYKREYNKGAATIKTFESETTASHEAKLDQQQDDYIKSDAGQAAIREHLPAITTALIKGHIKGDATRSPHDQARDIATERAIAAWREDQTNILERQMQRQTARLRAELARVATSFYSEQASIYKSAADEKSRLERKMQKALEERKARLMARVRFKPAEFAKALHISRTCEHLRTKAWGDNYATGVRCQDCGKEVTELHKEESQLLGYGSGCDYWMYDAIKRHRKDEAGFKFKDPKELEIVSKERIRLEKERREVELAEEQFYDFQDLKAIYEFDRRHQKELKSCGIFRQGLQWTEEQVLYYEQTKKIQEMARLEKEGIFSDSVLQDYDALKHIEDPPPTFRAAEERHKAQYKEFMYTMGRMHNFNKRIIELKHHRIDLLADRALYSAVLGSLHKESFTFENSLDVLEQDLERTGMLLDTYRKMYVIWSKANSILLEAQREKKRCEMRRCGLWDEISELKDDWTVLHAETKELIKIKYLHDVQISDLESALTKAREMSVARKEKWKIEESHAREIEYCQPGNDVQSRFGPGKVVMYRHDDQMLMVQLTFGNPLARLFIPAWDVINCERSKQNGEMLLMKQEDENQKQNNLIENSQRLKELYQMRREELACREAWEVADLQEQEEAVYAKRLEKSLHENYLVTLSKQFKEDLKHRVIVEREERLRQHEKRIRLYKGPKKQKPKPLSAYKKWKLKKQVEVDLRKRFILKGAAKDRRITRGNIRAERTLYLADRNSESLIEAALEDFCKEIASEALKEGNLAKINAEVISGIFFPTPVWMQYSTYCLLRDMWKDRKQWLKNNIQIGLGTKQNFESSTEENESEENMLRIAEAKRAQEIEVARQNSLISEMEEEERRCREFYHWEMVQNLRERRQMKEEEHAMREYMKEQKAIEESLKSKYAGVSDKMVEEEVRKAQVTNKMRRRNDLKDVALERRKMKEEQILMKIEDDLSLPLRDIDKKERQMKLLQQQLGLDAAEASATLEKREKAQSQQAFSLEALSSDTSKQSKGLVGAKRLTVEVPLWLELPDNWDEMSMAQQKKYVTLHETLRNLNAEIKEKHEKHRLLLKHVSKKNEGEWFDRATSQRMNEWSSELEFMKAEEDCREAENNLIKLKANVRKLSTFCQEKGEEELRLTTLIRDKEDTARKRDIEYDKAARWLEVCESRSKKRSKLKRRMETDCLWADTDSVTGFMQRFRTERLRKRLYWAFFNEIISSIVVRAEIITTERQLMMAQEGLSQNKTLLVRKIDQMKALWKEHQRDELMRTRRSVLNKTLFPIHRYTTLKDRFSSWVRFFLWNRGHREAFEIQYEVLKRKLDVDRQFKQQIEKDAPQEKTQSFATAMQKHKDRVIECSRCHAFYLDSQNSSMSCHYHSGEFKISCPRSCKDPGHSAMCIAHKKRRWTCCDSGNPKVDGCARKYHVPLESDPVYDEVMRKLNERDGEMVKNLNEKLQRAKEEDWVGKSINMTRSKVAEAEEFIADGREKVERYKTMIF